MTTAILVQMGAALLGLVTMSLVVVQSSTAAFSGTTATPGTWTAAEVSLSDDDGTAQATFSSPATMVPGDGDQACVTVEYTGDVDAEVRLYGATSASTGLGQYLDLTIDEVTGACASPDTVVPVYSGTVAVNAGAFVAAHPDWNGGAATSWDGTTPATPGATKVFRIAVTLQDVNDAQALTTTTTFTWEAQNV